MKEYYSIEIIDFGVILWLKLANSDDVICAINLYFVKIDKKKLQNGGDLLQMYHWTV